MPIDPISILAWAEVVVQVGAIFGKLIATGQQMLAGIAITQAQLDQSEADAKAAVARWDAAVAADAPARTPEPTPENN